MIESGGVDRKTIFMGQIFQQIREGTLQSPTRTTAAFATLKPKPGHIYLVYISTDIYIYKYVSNIYSIYRYR